MPAVAINSAFPTGDENTENAGVSNFNAGTGWGYTLSAVSNTEMIVFVTFAQNVTGLSMAFGGQAMTLLNPGGTAITSTNCGFTYAFHKFNPLTGAQQLTASWTTASLYRYSLMFFDNVVGGVSLASNSGSGLTASVVIPTGGANDAVMAMFQNDSNVATVSFSATPGAGTQQYTSSDAGGGSLSSCVDYLLGPSANQTMSNALSPTYNWVAVGVDLKNVAGLMGAMVM